MNEFTVKNFSAFEICRFNKRAYPSSTPKFTYTFKPGCYALTGQIDHGGWAFTHILANKSHKYMCIHDDVEYFIDGEPVSLSYLQSISWYVGSLENDRSAKKQFAKIKRKHKMKHSLEEMKELFGLTDERFDRRLSCTGNEKWRISAALGFAQDKKIFCFPWETSYGIKFYLYTIEKFSEIFEKNNCIMLIPIENEERMKHFIKDVIDLSQREIF